jgi:hypothetical protein
LVRQDGVFSSMAPWPLGSASTWAAPPSTRVRKPS